MRYEMTTIQDDDKNQKITINNYDQNSLCIILKQLITKSKCHQIKLILKLLKKKHDVNTQKYETFPQCD